MKKGPTDSIWMKRVSMKHDAIFLEVTREKNNLKIGIYEPGDVIWRYEDMPAPIDRVQTRCRDMMDALNQTSRNGGGGPQAVENLKAAGRMLGDELLTRTIKEALQRANAEYLVLRLDDHLVHIPWELICVDQDFLCERFSMGRLVKTRQEVARAGPRNMSRPLKMWIIANPRGDLDIAEAEGLKVFKDMARMNGPETIIDPVLDGDATPETIRERLKDYDFVHFAGHVDYDPENPAASGWRLSQNHFTAADIDRMAGGASMPALIFSNACQSARTEAWEWTETAPKHSFGLGNAFLRAGVKHYVGTSWEVMDEPSSYFAHEFYEQIRAGRAAGKAVRTARTNMTKQYGPNICWISYILYGDPTIAYFREGDPKKKPWRKSVPTAERKTALTRGALFNYSFNPTIGESVKTAFMILFSLALLVLAAAGGLRVNDWMDARSAQMENDQRLAMQKLLIERAEKQQERTSRLFDELAGLIKDLPPAKAASKTASPTLAAVFDADTAAGGREKMILYAIQEQIMASQSPFRLLEQASFDIVLSELVRKIRTTPAEKRVRPGLLMPDLILIIEAHETDNHTLVLMRLVEQDTRRILETVFEELDGKQRVLEQRKALTKNLLQKLKNYATDK